MLIARGDVAGPRRVKFRSFFGFGAIPNPDSYSSNRWFFEAKDGLGKVPDFFPRWGSVQALSNQVDALAGVPEGSGLVSLTRQLDATLGEAMRNAAHFFEWDCNPCGFVFGRSKARQAQLDGALSSLDAALTSYQTQVSQGLIATRAAIQARTDREAAEIAARAAAERAAQEAAQREAERAAAEQLLAKAQTEKAIVVEQKAVAVEQLDLVKAQAASLVDLNKAQKEAMIATGQITPFQAAMGNTTVLVGLAAAAGLGIYMFASKRRSRR
jgi:hypothetical protein